MATAVRTTRPQPVVSRSRVVWTRPGGVGPSTVGDPSLSAAQLAVAQALAGSSGASTIRFRYEQRTRNNAVLAKLTTAVISAEVTLDNKRSVSRTASLSIHANDLPASFVAPGSYFSVSMDALVAGVWTPFQLGLFRADVPARTFRPNDHEYWSLAGSDLTTEVAETPVSAPYTVAAGTGYIAAVRAILDSLGLNHNLMGTLDVTPVDFTWPAGTSYLKIINDLLVGLDWYPIWPDATGTFTSRARADYATRSPDVVYHVEQEPRMIREPFLRKETRMSGTNRIAVVTQDPARAPVSAVEVNGDGRSPTSTLALGKVVMKELTVDHILSAAMAATYADSELRESAMSAISGTLTTHTDPRRGAHESYRLWVTNVEYGSLWAVDSWTLSDKVGAEMTHQLRKATVASFGPG